MTIETNIPPRPTRQKPEVSGIDHRGVRFQFIQNHNTRLPPGVYVRVGRDGHVGAVLVDDDLRAVVDWLNDYIAALDDDSTRR